MIKYDKSIIDFIIKEFFLKLLFMRENELWKYIICGVFILMIFNVSIKFM